MQDAGIYYILDQHGEPVPVDLLTWARWFETADRVLAKDRQGEIRVSTVFLGIDHSFGFGPPLLWETMIFGGPPALEDYQERYASRAAALRGHRRAVEAAALSVRRMSPN